MHTEATLKIWRSGSTC